MRGCAALSSLRLPQGRSMSDSQLLALDRERVSTFILAVHEGWSALDRRGVKSASLALRTIFCWPPCRTPLAIGGDSSAPSAESFTSRVTSDTRQGRWRRLQLMSVGFSMICPCHVLTGCMLQSNRLLRIREPSTRAAERQSTHKEV
jgi:hypothetical protein